MPATLVRYLRHVIAGHTFRPSRALVALSRGLCAVCALVLWGVLGIQNAAPVHGADTLSSGGKIYFGLEYRTAPDVTDLKSYESDLQHGMSLVLWYQGWEVAGQLQAFPVALVDALRQHGSIPVLAWYPVDGPSITINQPKFTLASIIDGSWDTYIRQYATEVKVWGHPLFLRFASEMNGNWVPWSEMVNGNSAGQFAQAWRHVHDIFTAVGARNVTWTWCPNVENGTTTPLEELYPGNAYVDWACLDGYNFGPELNEGPWRTFSQIFSGTYQHLLRLIPPSMPIMIGETASVEHGGSKPDWITDALTRQLPSQYPRIKAVNWFNDSNPTINLRIDTSPQSLAALRAVLNSGIYTGNAYRYLDQSPIPPPEAVHPKASAPAISHDGNSPKAGYVEVLDTVSNQPIANARLTYSDGAATTTDAQGLAAMPGDGNSPVLQDIAVEGGVIAASLPLDRQAGYQVRIDLNSGSVVRVRVHDPPRAPVPTAHIPIPVFVTIGLAALTLVLVGALGLRAGRASTPTPR